MSKLVQNCGSLDEYQKPTKIEAPKILSKVNPDNSNFSSLSSISNDRSIQKYSSLPRLFLTSLDQPQKNEGSNYLHASQSLDDSTMKLSIKDESLSNVMTFGGQKDEKVEFSLNSDIEFDLEQRSSKNFKQKVSRKKSKKRKTSVKKTNIEEEPVKLQRLPARPPTKKTVEKPPKPVLLKAVKHVDSIRAIESPISVINELDEENQQSTMQKISRRININESSSQDDFLVSQSQQLLVSPHPQDSNYTSVISEAFKMPRLNISSQFTTRQSVEHHGQLPPIDQAIELASPICSPSSSKQLHFVKLRQSVASMSTKLGTASEASNSKNDQQASSREQLVKIQEFNCEPQIQYIEEIPSEDETEKERLAEMFSSSWLAGLVIRHWLSAVKKIKIARSDYETQQSNAEQLHYAVIKQKIMRAFTNYCSNQKDKKTAIHRLLDMKHKKTLRLALNQYKQIVMIGRAQCFFKIKSLVSSFQKWLKYHNSIKCLKGTRMIYNRRLKTKALASLMCFADIMAQKRSRLEVATALLQRTHLRIKQLVLIHLSEYAVYQRRLRQAKMLSEHKTKFKCLRWLLQYTEKRQSKAQNTELILSFYRCSLASKSIKMFRLGCQLAQQSRLESANKFNLLKRSKLFFAMANYLNSQQIARQANIKQAKASIEWLELSLGSVMEQVWVDFPRQKLARNAQGKPNLLLNFMSLAKRKRYRDFFTKINDQLRAALMARVFDALIAVVQRTSQGKRHFRARKIAKYFKAFRDQCFRNVITKNLAINTFKKRQRTTLMIVFKALKLAMRVGKSHKAKYYAISQGRTSKTLIRTWRRWIERKNKKLFLERQAEVSGLISRSKILSSCVAQWLHQLKLKLKKRHLNQLNGKLPTQRKFFQAWICATAKQQQQQQKLTLLQSTYQVRIVKTAIQQWKLFTGKSLNYKRVDGFCKQQYTYWLGKRVFACLVRNAGAMKSKTRVLNTVLYEYLRQIKMKTFQAVKLYTQFRLQRRADDLNQLGQIVSNRVRRVFGKWYRAASQRQGLRLLTSLVKLAQKRIGLGKIKSWVTDETWYIQQHRNCRLYKVLMSWTKIARNGKESAHKIQQIVIGKQGMIFGLWKKQIQAQILSKKLKLTQEAAHIRQAKKQVLEALAWNVRLNHISVTARKWLRRKLLKRALAALTLNIGVQLGIRSSEKSLYNRHNFRTKQKFMKVWLQSFNRITYVIGIAELMAREKMKKIFTIFKQNLVNKRLKQNSAFELKQQWQKLVVRKSLVHMSKIVKIRVMSRQQKTQAEESHNRRYMKVAFFQLKSKVTKLTKALVQLKLQRRERMKKQFIKIWITRCSKRIDKIRSIRRINSYFFKLDLKKTIATWKQESKFLSNLENKSMMGYKILQAIRVKRALNCMHTNAQQQQLTRKFNVTSQLFFSTQRKNQCFKILRRYQKLQTEQNTAKLKALSFYKNLASGKVIRQWKSFTKKHAKLWQSFEKLRQYQRRSLLPQMMFKWHLALQERFQEQQVEKIAEQKYKQTMQMQALKGLVQFSILRMHKRQMIQQAQQLFESKVKKQVFNKIAFWKECKNDLEERRQQLFFVVQDIAEIVCQKKAWASLIANQKNTKQMACLAANLRSQVLSRKLLKLLAKNVVVQRKLTKLQKQIQSKTQKQTFKCYFKMWHLGFLQCLAIKEAMTSYEINLARKVIGYWKDSIQLTQQKRYFATRNRLVLSVKAVEAWKRYFHYKKLSKLKKLKAYQQLARKLMFKSLKAFAIYKHRNALVGQIRENRATQTLRTFLLRWDRSLQLKLMRSDAFSNCYLLAVKYAFRNWVQNVQILNRFNYFTSQCYHSRVVKALDALKLNVYRVKVQRYLDDRAKQLRVKQKFSAWRSITPFKQEKVINSIKPGVERTLQMAFNQILNFNDHQRRLERMKESKIFEQKKPQCRSLWLNQLLVQDTVNKLINLHLKLRYRLGIQILKQHSHDCQVSEQNLIIVAGNLNQKQGSLVIMLQQCLGQQKTQKSDTILLKCLFQQWRKVGLPLLRKINNLKDIQEFSAEKRKKNTMSQFLALWIEAYRYKRNKNCVQAYITQNYLDRLQRKAFFQLRNYAVKQKPKHLARGLCQILNGYKVQKIFLAWNGLMQRSHVMKQKWNDAIWECQQKRLKRVWDSFRIQCSRRALIVEKYQQLVASKAGRVKQQCMVQLQLYVQSQRMEKEQGELAEHLRERQLKRKLVRMLRYNKISSAMELRYSRQFAVFTAWKTQIREAKLLSQYLDECNFKPPPSIKPTQSYSDY